VIDLGDTYARLAHPWPREQLAARYEEAERSGERRRKPAPDDLPRPIALLATAIPASATLSVAIHVLHTLPKPANDDLAEQLLTTAETNAADALHRCHRAFELDGAAHDYTTDDWLPVICEIAAPLLESSRLDQEPPSVVEYTQDAVRWLSSAVAKLDSDSPEAPAALADALARLLIVYVFADAALDRARPS
jgi:hypothetical protein